MCQSTNLAASATVIDLSRGGHFATIRRVAVAICKAGTADGRAFGTGTTRGANSSSVIIGALCSAGTAIVGTIF